MRLVPLAAVGDHSRREVHSLFGHEERGTAPQDVTACLYEEGHQVVVRPAEPDAVRRCPGVGRRLHLPPHVTVVEQQVAHGGDSLAGILDEPSTHLGAPRRRLSEDHRTVGAEPRQPKSTEMLRDDVPQLGAGVLGLVSDIHGLPFVVCEDCNLADAPHEGANARRASGRVSP